MKNSIQRFGKFLSAMVMPNIGALIAFGFLAALFIDTGWIPNEGFNSLVSPMLTYLIPILIASTGGRMIGGDRGRVVAAIAVIGAIMSNTSITMLMVRAAPPLRSSRADPPFGQNISLLYTIPQPFSTVQFLRFYKLRPGDGFLSFSIESGRRICYNGRRSDVLIRAKEFP